MTTPFMLSGRLIREYAKKLTQCLTIIDEPPGHEQTYGNPSQRILSFLFPLRVRVLLRETKRLMLFSQIFEQSAEGFQDHDTELWGGD